MKQTILNFTGKDGIISHCKLTGKKTALQVYYVKDCKQVMKFDVNSKQTVLVGTTPDAIVAMHVHINKLRTVDLSDANIEEQKDPEKGIDTVVIATADESENICIFSSDNLDGNHKPIRSCKIKQADKAPSLLKQKDLFGLGYPYFITSYAGFVAVSTDFGICLLNYK